MTSFLMFVYGGHFALHLSSIPTINKSIIVVH